MSTEMQHGEKVSTFKWKILWHWPIITNLILLLQTFTKWNYYNTAPTTVRQESHFIYSNDWYIYPSSLQKNNCCPLSVDLIYHWINLMYLQTTWRLFYNENNIRKWEQWYLLGRTSQCGSLGKNTFPFI